MKTRHEFQLEFEEELAAIEEQIDEMRRQRREEQRARAQNSHTAPRTVGPLILPGDD